MLDTVIQRFTLVFHIFSTISKNRMRVEKEPPQVHSQNEINLSELYKFRPLKTEHITEGFSNLEVGIFIFGIRLNYNILGKSKLRKVKRLLKKSSSLESLRSVQFLQADSVFIANKT